MAHYQFVLLAMCVLLCSACGGGENAADMVNREARYIPDVSTPEGATEAYARAIETGSISLAQMVFLEEERESLVPEFRAYFQQSEKQGIHWKIELSEAHTVADDRVQARIDYVKMKDGKEVGREKSVIVFIRLADGTWRYSRALSRKLMQELQNAPAGNESNAPANSPCGG